jgi:hypothetical protein
VAGVGSGDLCYLLLTVQADAVGRGVVMDNNRFEVIGTNLWMRCDCGTWLLVQGNGTFVGEIYEKPCHGCGTRWVYSNGARDWVKEEENEQHKRDHA